jgi:hypothetical protein
MPSLWQEPSRRRLVDRLGRLKPDAARRWGRMSCPQMLAHVNDGLRMAIGELPAKPRRGPLRRTPLKQLAIYVMPWPKGVPTAPELLARIDGAQWEAEVAAFPGLLARFAARAAEKNWPDHPAFGRMSRRDWGFLQYRHIDHHFRQFGG